MGNKNRTIAIIHSSPGSATLWSCICLGFAAWWFFKTGPPLPIRILPSLNHLPQIWYLVSVFLLLVSPMVPLFSLPFMLPLTHPPHPRYLTLEPPITWCAPLHSSCLSSLINLNLTTVLVAVILLIKWSQSQRRNGKQKWDSCHYSLGPRFSNFLVLPCSRSVAWWFFKIGLFFHPNSPKPQPSISNMVLGLYFSIVSIPNGSFVFSTTHAPINLSPYPGYLTLEPPIVWYAPLYYACLSLVV